MAAFKPILAIFMKSIGQIITVVIIQILKNNPARLVTLVLDYKTFAHFEIMVIPGIIFGLFKQCKSYNNKVGRFTKLS